MFELRAEIRVYILRKMSHPILRKIIIFWKSFLLLYFSIIIHENLFICSRVVSYMQADRQTNGSNGLNRHSLGFRMCLKHTYWNSHQVSEQLFSVYQQSLKILMSLSLFRSAPLQYFLLFVFSMPAQNELLFAVFVDTRTLYAASTLTIRFNSIPLSLHFSSSVAQ